MSRVSEQRIDDISRCVHNTIHHSSKVTKGRSAISRLALVFFSIPYAEGRVLDTWRYGASAGGVVVRSWSSRNRLSTAHAANHHRQIADATDDGAMWVSRCVGTASSFLKLLPAMPGPSVPARERPAPVRCKDATRARGSVDSRLIITETISIRK